MCLYGHTPARFESDYSIAQSTEKLKAVINPSRYSLYNDCFAAGKVTALRIQIHRPHPYERNAFIPLFVGTFAETDQQVILSGVFTVDPLVKVFTTIWLAALYVPTGAMLFRHFCSPQVAHGTFLLSIAPISLALTAMFVFFCFGVLYGSSRAAGDKEWIADLITRTLNADRDSA